MTEIDDLGALFRPGPQFTPAQKAHIERVQEWEKRETLDRMALVQFFAPVLCSCSMYYDREAQAPPQVECSIHGMLMAHPYTGQVILPGMPMSPATFTPAQAPQDNDEE